MWILIKPLLLWLKKAFKILFLFLGVISFIMLILSFTSLPFWADYYLGISADTLKEDPEVIVVLGGSGMPSPNGLIRTFYGTEAALAYQDANIIIALPGDTLDRNSSIRLMAEEMIMRGVDSNRITFENEGTNTRWEALNVKNRFFPNSNPAILLVSSPAHMYRSVKAFQKAGFSNVGGLPSFTRANETSLDFDASQLGGSNSIPDVGNQISLRYSIWARLHIQISVLREYMAINSFPTPVSPSSKTVDVVGATINERFST